MQNTSTLRMLLTGMAMFATPAMLMATQPLTVPQTVKATPTAQQIVKADNSAKSPQKAATKDETTGLPGNLEAPDSETFEALLNTQEDFDRFYNFSTDYGDPANWDFRKGWYFSAFSECACILNYIDEEAYDEWLITPAIEMEAGKKYIISFVLQTDSWFSRSMMELKAGDTPTVEAMTETVCEPFTFIIDDEANPQCGFFYTPQRTGTYYIGFHAMNEAGKGGFGMKSVRISSPQAEVIPSEDEIEYDETVLMDVDLTTVTQGTMENPFKLTTNGALVDGFEGWLGNEIYSVAGQGLLIKNTMGEESNGAALVPKFADTKDFSTVRYSLTLDVPEFSSVVTGVDWMSTYQLFSHTTVAPYAYQTSTLYSNSLAENTVKTYDWIVDMPQNPVMLWTVDGKAEYGEAKPDCLSLYIQSTRNSNILVKNIKVTGLVPKLATPANAHVSAFDGAKATVAWDAVEGADGYVVRIYRSPRCSGSDYYLETYEQVRTDGTSVDIENIDTKMSATVVQIFALGKGTRSRNAQVRIIEHKAPEMTIAENSDGKLHLEWTTPENNVLTLVNVLKGEKIEGNGKGHAVASINVADIMNTEGSSISLAGEESSWVAESGAISVKDGVLSSQGNMFSQLVVMSNSAYDFSDATSDVTLKVTARTDGNCLMNVAFVAPDAETNALTRVAYEYVPLTREFDTYEVKLPALDVARVEVSFGGYDMVYFKDLEISCDLPDGTIFYHPYKSEGVRSFGGTAEAMDMDMPTSEFTNIKAWGMNARYEYYDAENPARNVLSQYSEPVILEKVTAGVGCIRPADAEIAPIYYNLQGIRVDNPSDGIYVKVTGDKATKVTVK